MSNALKPPTITSAFIAGIASSTRMAMDSLGYGGDGCSVGAVRVSAFIRLPHQRG